MSNAIEFSKISKQYRLGLVSTKTLSHDLDRWWKVNVLHKDDPYLKIGSVNDRTIAADSEYVWALRDIDFSVEQGDVVGIIGKNGAGKSTLLKLLSRITAPTVGTIRAKGRIGALLEVGTGFHSEMTGRENIYLNGAIMGMSKQEITKKLDEIIAFSGCERYIDTPVKRYSSGMTVRLGFAVAAHLDPEILVVDEVLAVGDAEFQKKAIGKMQEVSRGEGRTVLFVSHNMSSIRALCKHGVLLENGQVKKTGLINDIVDEYLKDEDSTTGPILDSVKVYSQSIFIEGIRINGTTDNDVFLHSGEHTLCIEIDGTSMIDQVIEIEAQLLDERRTLLASFFPCHSEGRSTMYESGRFKISETIDLPINMATGTYLFNIQLTYPNVEYLMELKHPIHLHVDGLVTAAGSRLNYNNVGLLVL